MDGPSNQREPSPVENRATMAPAPSRRVRFRPLSFILIAAALALFGLAIYYAVTPASSLPSFFPGHQVGSTHHHVKHGIVAAALGVAALLGAWFSTAPSRPRTEESISPTTAREG